jgi:dimethylargininase
MTTKKALVRRPGPLLADGLLTHLDRRPVDLPRALDQWSTYVETLEGAGWEIIEVEPADGCPDAVFIEDTMVVFGGLAVISHPGADVRRPELPSAERAVLDLGYAIDHIREPGTLDGGDVLKIHDTVYVGLSSRTNAEGICQLRNILKPRGAQVVAVPVTKALHLKTAATALVNGTVIGHLPVVDDATVFPRFRPVPEPSGGNVVLLDDDRVLIASGCPGSEAVLVELGYVPVAVDLSEFQKLEGSATCLSVRLREPPPAGGPAA